MVDNAHAAVEDTYPFEVTIPFPADAEVLTETVRGSNNLEEAVGRCRRKFLEAYGHEPEGLLVVPLGEQPSLGFRHEGLIPFPSVTQYAITLYAYRTQPECRLKIVQQR